MTMRTLLSLSSSTCGSIAPRFGRSTQLLHCVHDLPPSSLKMVPASQWSGWPFLLRSRLIGSRIRPDDSRRSVALHSVIGFSFHSLANGLKVLASSADTQAKAEAGGYLFCALLNEW